MPSQTSWRFHQPYRTKIQRAPLKAFYPVACITRYTWLLRANPKNRSVPCLLTELLARERKKKISGSLGDSCRSLAHDCHFCFHAQLPPSCIKPPVAELFLKCARPTCYLWQSCRKRRERERDQSESERRDLSNANYMAGSNWLSHEQDFHPKQFQRGWPSHLVDVYLGATGSPFGGWNAVIEQSSQTIGRILERLISTITVTWIASSRIWHSCLDMYYISNSHWHNYTVRFQEHVISLPMVMYGFRWKKDQIF